MSVLYDKKDKNAYIVPDITVSIVSHNSKDDLTALMPTLANCLKRLNAEILIVDNRSEDGSVEFLKKAYPQAVVTVNKVRKGYGANHNINLEKARGRYIIFMNADIVLSDQTILQLKDFMDHDHSIGICCPNVLNEDGSLQFLNKRYPTILDLFVRRFQFLFSKRFIQNRSRYYEMRDTGYEKSTDIPFISGCFMFCRTRIIRSVKGFDERFFLYFEDVDLCRKVQKNARTVSCPDAKVIHRWERSAHKNVKWFLVFLESAVRYFNKWGYIFK
ncbi:glycosyltransferase family 2 protein [Desulfobacter sp.]|uniref:glycosyltransferase family 2 protein n=1 Tax=Desulfobacter sp. TaxID=2294 RepID=UPI003D1189A6